MKIEDKISEKIRKQMKDIIEEASGNEVFFRGIPNDEGIVDEVVVLARGNRNSVPAILKQMKKEEVIIHNHPSGYLYPSDADVNIAAIYSDRKNGASYIVNNSVDDIYVIVELKKIEEVPIDISPYFEKKGMLSQVFPEFEVRDEQLDMAKVIEKGLNSNKKVIVEAGTGTGKTLAYLIPTIEWAIKNEKKVIVSTNTINLQEQLLNKDIPIIKKVIQGDFSYILVKGRGNYLCNRKVINIKTGSAPDLEELTASQKDQYEYIVKWSGKTENGDRGELPFEVEYTVWENFYSESDMCIGNKCPHKNECYFLKAREEKKKADLLITNHHMYFADLSIRKEIGFNTEYAILPDYDLVVFDEAHNIEGVARDYFSYEVSKLGFNKGMNQIYPQKSKKKQGQIQLLLNYLKTLNFKDFEKVKKLFTDEIIDLHIDLYKKGNDYFERVIESFTHEGQSNANIRLRKEELEHFIPWKDILVAEEELFITYSVYSKRMKRVTKWLEELEDEKGIINEFSKYLGRVENFFKNLHFIKSMDDDEFIYWLSVNRKKNRLKFTATPLKISSELETSLFVNLEKIVFTSATIAVDKSFSYFKKSIGLQEETLEEIIHSPFNYEKQMRVYIPSDIPLPNAKNFIDEIHEFIKKLIYASKGNTFILFTSYATLNYVYYLIKDDLEENGLQLFVQGTAPRNKLVNDYKLAPRPVLFGTDSFWEGVDVKGDKLTSVILVKLPFKVPSDPVIEAIIENIEKEGRNPFMEYQIPESVIKFKQGIGRLIRSKEDRGVITILDTRIIKKRYGEIFLNSIPTKRILVKRKDQIIR